MASTELPQGSRTMITVTGARVGSQPGKPASMLPRFVTVALVLFFMVCTVFFVFVVGLDALRAFRPSPQASSTPGSQANAAASSQAQAPAGNSSDAKEQVLSVKVDAYEKQADEIEKLISLFTGLSVLYALALGVGAYIGVQQNLQQAQAVSSEIKDLRDKAVDQQEKLHDEFPLFGYVDTNLRRITKRLVEILPFKGFSDQIYANLKRQPRRIQEILYYEKTAASLEFFELSSIRVEVSQIYQGLGDFYALKSQDEKTPEDKNRGSFYLEQATLVNCDNYAAWNDRAWVALVLENPPNYAAARQFSEASLRINTNQQRALYNLAICEHVDGHFSKVEELTSHALELDKWQEAENPARVHNLYYNRACGRCCLSKHPGDDPKHRSPATLVRKALDDIQAALSPQQLEHWDLQDWKDVVSDFEGGDLLLLKQQHPREVQELLEQKLPAVPQDLQEKDLKRLFP